jgi:regulator of sigma E protease
MLDKIFGVINLFIGFSLSIAILNLLPIPLLDGGHVIYFIIRRIFSDSLPEFITKIYLAVGITTLIFIFLFITFNDIFYK